MCMHVHVHVFVYVYFGQMFLDFPVEILLVSNYQYIDCGQTEVTVQSACPVF